MIRAVMEQRSSFKEWPKASRTGLVMLLLGGIFSASARGDAPVAGVFTNDSSVAEPSLARLAADEIHHAGFITEFIGPETLTNAASLQTRHFDLLALPHARTLPAASAAAVEAYLHDGGRLVALGLPAWDCPTFTLGGRTFSKQDYQALVDHQAPDHVIIDFAHEDIFKWIRGVGGDDTKTTVAIEPLGGNAKALHVTIDNLGGWDVLLSPALRDPFPGGRTLTCFRARGEANTREMSIEWDEEDGSRWIAVIDLSPEWKTYCLPPEAFHFWPSAPGRGGRGDHLDVRHAKRLSVGLARSHSAFIGERQEYWIGNIGAARPPLEAIATPEALEAPLLDTLSPGWKFFSIHGPVNLSTPTGLALLPPARCRWTDAAVDPPLAVQPRPRAAGFKQERPWRWQPLLEARSAGGDFRGAVATLMLHTDDEFHGGVWACFTPDDPEFYQQRQVRQLLRQTAEIIHRGLFLIEGGSEFFTVFAGQKFSLGARIANFGPVTQSNVVVRVTVRRRNRGEVLWSRQWTASLSPGEDRVVEDQWQPPDLPENGAIVSTELLQNNRVIDQLEHELHAWHPKPAPRFIEARDGGFWLGGKPWKANGVNYMPSTGMAITSGRYFNNWLGKGAYDPEAIGLDLRRIVAMNVNALSIFIGYNSLLAQHLLDFLRRCDALGLHVNMALQVGTPLNFQWTKIKQLIEFYHMAENDSIFAYDLAWEPEHRDQQNTYGRDWTQWIINRYGSVETAEKFWGQTLASINNAGTLVVPPMRDLAHDGPWRALAADYRAFLDWELERKYGEARRLVRSIDPHHAVSFRMSEAGDPSLNSAGELPYDFYGLVRAVDIWEPEGYGRIGDWNRVREGRFTVDYARACDPSKPVVWAEAGYDAWDQEHANATQDRLDFAGEFYRDFYRMMIEAGSDGVFFWYYPGGFRTGERSDFGVINPDGTDRPQTVVIRQEGPLFLSAAKPPPANRFFLINRDRDARGLFGIYQSIKKDYWQAIADGETPELKWEKPPGQHNP